MLNPILFFTVLSYGVVDIFCFVFPSFFASAISLISLSFLNSSLLFPPLFVFPAPFSPVRAFLRCHPEYFAHRSNSRMQSPTTYIMDDLVKEEKQNDGCSGGQPSIS